MGAQKDLAAVQTGRERGNSTWASEVEAEMEVI